MNYNARHLQSTPSTALGSFSLREASKNVVESRRRQGEGFHLCIAPSLSDDCQPSSVLLRTP